MSVINSGMDSEIKVGLVIMASGLGKRFGSNKLMEPLDGKPLIRWIVETTDELFNKRVVVTRSGDVLALMDQLKVECICHEFPNRNDTIRLGVEAVFEDVDYLFFAPSDQPLIKRVTFEELIKRANENPEVILRTCFGETVGMPTGFPKKYFSKLLALPEKMGGGYVISNHPKDVEYVSATDEYELWDVDTRADFNKVQDMIFSTFKR